jgi:hypothetical protein
MARSQQLTIKETGGSGIALGTSPAALSVHEHLSEEPRSDSAMWSKWIEGLLLPAQLTRVQWGEMILNRVFPHFVLLSIKLNYIQV